MNFITNTKRIHDTQDTNCCVYFDDVLNENVAIENRQDSMVKLPKISMTTHKNLAVNINYHYCCTTE